MRKLTLPLLITLVLAWLPRTDAQIFGRKPQAPSRQRVSELVVQAKADPDDRKRSAAAEELRDFDVKVFQEIVPVLVDIARSDPKASVRLAAIDSLAKIRPVTQIAGQTLEWAAVQDDSWKVRWQAKSSLMRYQLAGYHNGKNDSKGAHEQGPTTGEPPLFEKRSPDPKNVRAPFSAGTVSRPASTPTALPSNQPRFVAPPPAIVTAPQLPKAVAPVAKNQPATTPPPLIVATPNMPAPKLVVPTVPGTVVVNSPKTAPVAVPASGATEPNFRPAGQTPPRFSTATPQLPQVAPLPAPPTKTESSGPTLTPPM